MTDKRKKKVGSTPAFLRAIGGSKLEGDTRYLMQSISDAWERGAVVCKNGKEIYGVPEFAVLMEDSSYMIDLEDDDSGRIVRINFQKVNKDII